MWCQYGRRVLVMLGVLQALCQVPTVTSQPLDCLIEPYVVVNISSAVEGVLNTVTVERGDLVKKGQVLATLDTTVEQASVAVFQARATMDASLSSTRARLELHTRRHTRNTGLFNRSLIPADEMDEAETSRRLAELDLLEAEDARRLAELELRRAMAELERRTLRSPITGVVVERFRSAGEFANEEPILKLAQLDPLRVEVFVPLALLGKVTVGMRAQVQPEAPLRDAYEARVTVVDRVINAASGTFGVRLELPNRGYRLSAGLKCTVHLPTEP